MHRAADKAALKQFAATVSPELRGPPPMPDSVYKVIELVGTSTESWEKAAKAAVERASKSLRDLRIAEVSALDMHLKDVDAPEVCKHVKKNPDLQLTKVIAMSGKLTDQESQGLHAQGFDAFLRKPFHVRQVIQAVEDAMAIVY